MEAELVFLEALVEDMEAQAGALERTSTAACKAAWAMRKQVGVHRARITILGEALPGVAPSNDA